MSAWSTRVECTAAATYTSNQLKAAPLARHAGAPRGRQGQAIVANAGCANAATGEQGLDNAVEMAQLAAEKLGIDPHDVVVASTGVIGTQLPMDRIANGIEKIVAVAGRRHRLRGRDHDHRHRARSTSPSRNGDWTIGAVCKGVGMIHPNMATMLCFMTTDAPVEQAFLRRALSRPSTSRSTWSTSTATPAPTTSPLVLANGLAGGAPIDGRPPRGRVFQKALHARLHQHGPQDGRTTPRAGPSSSRRKVEGAASRRGRPQGGARDR